MKEIKDLLRKLKPVMGEKTRGLWYLNLLSKDSKAAQGNKDLLRLLADSKAKQDYKETISLPPPDPDVMDGEYPIGTVIYPEEDYAKFGLREDEFIKHILIVGMTGTGKTNLAFHILRELARHDKPFLVFDWKRNYRDLRQLPEFKDLRVIRLGDPGCDFKFNPLIPPPGVHPKHWMAMLIDVMKHAFFVGHGVEYFLRKGIDYLYNQFGIYAGKQSYPTFKDLEKVMRKEFVRGREMLWMSSTKRTLASLTFSGLLGDVLNVRRQEGIDQLLKQNVIIEMDNLATIEKIFFIEALLLWIYEFRKQEGKREVFKHAILIEEAHHVLSKSKERSAGEETIIETTIRMIREFGEAVIVLDQEPSKVSDSIKANTNCKVCFTLGHGGDVSDIARSMNLLPEQKRMIDLLDVGHAIVKMKGRFDEPVHVRFPLVGIKKGLYLDSNDEIKKSVGSP
ncbi:MAG: ATP-binding protein [Candidatus Marinimicrobia bacterium]|nr:ATP-binding protein [Candidatus Neomarinimicrobiota bacterium]